MLLKLGIIIQRQFKTSIYLRKKIIKENCIYTFAVVAMNILSMSHAFHLIIILHVSISHHLSKIGHPGECEPAYNRPSPPPSAK